ncbi:MAG: PAS domain S-box protein [Deltaproteobacteria bacterium]|nr:PAS domain S-box protein [Deltaproteobacteria bacterium]
MTPPPPHTATLSGKTLGHPPRPAFLAWLEEHKKEILREWASRLAGLSPRYAARSAAELGYTVRGAYAAYHEALATGSLAGIEQFIDYITRKRLKAGFPLSAVQQAFELFRTIVVERLLAPGREELLAQALPPLNACLSHTIQGFSDYFQAMHDQVVNDHARELEKEVAARTVELADERRRYKALVEEISDGFVVIQKSKIRFANPAFCRMHGVSREDALGRPFLRFVAPASRPLVREVYRRAMAGEETPRFMEYDRLGCPPERAATEMKARLVDLGQGRLTLGICRDISERLNLEAQAREHERLAYLGQLTASLSHEIRNPLSAIKMNLQILCRNLEVDGFDRRRLDITASEVGRLEEVMRQLLDTVRPMRLEPVPVDLASLARTGLDLLEPRLRENQLAVRQRHARNLPPVLGDAASLQQAWQNLLFNALDASPPGGVLTVWTRKGRAQGVSFLELGVRDQGPGIAPADLPLLFKPFFTRKQQGTGLGLLNVKRVMEAHGGEVTVRTRPGQGATFALRLPCLP